MSTQPNERENLARAVISTPTTGVLPYPVDMSAFLALPHGPFDTSEKASPARIAQYALAHWNCYLSTGREDHYAVFLTQARWFVEHEVRTGEDAGGWPILLHVLDKSALYCSSPIMNFHDQSRYCHAERSEASLCPSRETLRCAQGDNTFPMGLVKVHHRGSPINRGPCLSALAQGCAISVLVRAYQATHEEVFLAAARRAVGSFEQDILDNGVAAPVGADGVFFEEVAVYPAAHTLSGFLFALLGLYDYKEFSSIMNFHDQSRCCHAERSEASLCPSRETLRCAQGDNTFPMGLVKVHNREYVLDKSALYTDDAGIEKLISRALATLHRIIGEFDTGYWTYTDLLHRRLATPAQLSLQVSLLEALGRCADCDHCTMLALRWRNYQRRPDTRLRYQIAGHCRALGARFIAPLRDQLRAALFPKAQATSLQRVCVPLAWFPFTGGVLTVLEGIAQVTGDIWKIEYLAQQVGPNERGYRIHRFGTTKTDSWFFPMVWLYSLAGFGKLISLMRHGASYDLLLPQDGVFTGIFAGLAARLAGVRVVCIDHSTLTSLKSPVHHAERIQFIATKPWLPRLLHRLLTVPYWPSLYLQAAIAARFIDHYLVPGIAGDGVEEVLSRFGIHESHITRFASMVDIDRHIVLDEASRTCMRQQKGIAADAIVIAIICRLSPEKGVDIALNAISQALSATCWILPAPQAGSPHSTPDVRGRVRVIIAGEGPLREQIEEDIARLGLSSTCLLWGNIAAEEVVSLLAISDIFLYTSTRGACFPMAVLEAMASGCAVIASTQPASNGVLLADGRGTAVQPGDVPGTAEALTRLVSDPDLSRRMGQAARDYIAQQHSPTAFRRALLRTTYWPGGVFSRADDGNIMNS